eukprot:TRINITY_DN94774_c0_g1_i1.p1 TRINITY_DN94774_c0_g1~~TRINITY_DN94774_c0_g1_i1.p1  ORF type:complete len:510 (+),score=55.47 TRINITY_DN94774_c0_g1_i1:81-1532(+)
MGGGGGGYQPNSQDIFQPIASLTPYTGKWRIKARVIDKSGIREWNNARGTGKLFSFTLADSTGEAIRATMFQEGVDKYYEFLENDKVYIFSGGTIKTANKKWSTLPANYEISMDANCYIDGPLQDDNSITRETVHFTQIGKIRTKEANSLVNVLAAVIEVKDVQNLRTKDFREITKRTVIIGDDSNVTTELTLWGDSAHGFVAPPGTVICCKDCKVNEYNQSKSLGTSRDHPPTFPEDQQYQQIPLLRDWYQMYASGQIQPETLTNKTFNEGPKDRRPLGVILSEGMGTKLNDKGDGGIPEFLNVRAWMFNLKTENMVYAACGHCNKKLEGTGDGATYRCNKCMKNVDNLAWRYILNFVIHDHTGQQWVTAFGDSAEGLMGSTVTPPGKLPAAIFQENETNNPGYKEELARALTFRPYVVRLKVQDQKMRDSDEMRLRCTAMRIEPIALDWSKECQQLLADIDRYDTLPVLDGGVQGGGGGFM